MFNALTDLNISSNNEKLEVISLPLSYFKNSL